MNSTFAIPRTFALATILLSVAAPARAALNVPHSEYGISFGNSATFHGLRFNWKDDGVRHISGLNFTFGRPGLNPGATYEGIVVALAGNSGDRIGGLYASLIGEGNPLSEERKNRAAWAEGLSVKPFMNFINKYTSIFFNKIFHWLPSQYL